MKETLQKLALLPLFVGLFVMTACNSNNNDLWYDDIPSGRFDGTITAVVQDGDMFNDLIEEVIAIMYWEQGEESGQEVIATGEWSEGGFTITLPTTIDSRFLFRIGDEFDGDGIMISDRNARMSSGIYFGAINADFDPNDPDGDGFIGGFEYYLSTQNLSAWAYFVYVDRNVTITGVRTWEGSDERDIYSVFLERGWNKIFDVSRQVAGRRENTFTTEPISGLVWDFNCWDCPDITIPVTGVTISQTTATLTSLEETLNLTANVLPGNATNREVMWASDDDAVATVTQNGLVTPRGEGTTTIRVITVDGGFTASSVVTVTLTTEPPPPPPPPPNGQTIEIVADVQQSGQFGFVQHVRAVIDYWPTEQTIAQSDFVAQGNINFTLTLAETPQAGSMFSASELEEGGLQVSDPNANIMFGDLLIVGYISSGGPFDWDNVMGRFWRGAEFTSGSVEVFQEVFFVYADRDVIIEGIIHDGNWTEWMELSLQRGWNEVFFSEAWNSETSEGNISYTTEPLPSQMWRFDSWGQTSASPMSTRTHERRTLRRR